MTNERKRLFFKLAIIVLGTFIFFHVLNSVIQVLLMHIYLPWADIGYDSNLIYIRHALPLTKLLPAIPLAVLVWDYTDKLKTRTLLIIFLALVLVILQPVRFVFQIIPYGGIGNIEVFCGAEL